VGLDVDVDGPVVVAIVVEGVATPAEGCIELVGDNSGTG